MTINRYTGSYFNSDGLIVSPIAASKQLERGSPRKEEELHPSQTVARKSKSETNICRYKNPERGFSSSVTDVDSTSYAFYDFFSEIYDRSTQG